MNDSNGRTTHLRRPEDVAASRRTRLRRGRVLIVGVGGLGSPAALALAAAGVGTIGLMDGDVVDVSNLHRQIAFDDHDIGCAKASAAARRLRGLNPDVTVRALDVHVTARNVDAIFPDFDFIIDGTDHVAAKYLINDAALRHGVPFSHAGVVGFQGQTMTVVPGRSACVRCLFPSPPEEGEIPGCQEAGIIGGVAGSIGFIQAAEAVKHVLGVGRLLTDRLLTYDALSGRWRTVALARAPRCPLCSEGSATARIESAGTGRR